MLSSIKLPPKTAKNGIMFRIGEKNGQSPKTMQSAVQAINVSGDKLLFNVLTIQLGVGVKYNFDNTRQTFISDDRFLYVDVADDSPPATPTVLPVEQFKSDSQQEKPQKRMRGSRPF